MSIWPADTCVREALACVGKRFSHTQAHVQETRNSLRVFQHMHTPLYLSGRCKMLQRKILIPRWENRYLSHKVLNTSPPPNTHIHTTTQQKYSINTVLEAITVLVQCKICTLVMNAKFAILYTVMQTSLLVFFSHLCVYFQHRISRIHFSLVNICIP